MATATVSPAAESSLFDNPTPPIGEVPITAPHLVVASRKPPQPKPTVKDIASSYSIFQLDSELDVMVDEMQDEIDSNGQASDDSMERFKLFCDAHNDKVDRIARFLKLQESVIAHAKAEAGRFAARAKSGDNKARQIKNMMLWYLTVRGLAKLEGNDFAISRRINSQDSVKVTDDSDIPLSCMTVTAQFNADVWNVIEKALPDNLRERLTDGVQSTCVDNEAIKAAYKAGNRFEGVTVERGFHVRVS